MATSNSNRLAREKSPYLLQHKDNPVDWYPWGEEAFQKARSENKPIFLSVGYSTCHWCHVMERESFENENIAKIMNDHFVNIKVDREERPDVDHVYMNFVQALTGGGGWPMSVFLTPDLEPFFGGTYFPSESGLFGRGGTSFPQLLLRISQMWREKGGELREQGVNFIQGMRQELESERIDAGDKEKVLSDAPTIFERTVKSFAAEYDVDRGGFGGAPKFPRPSIFNFLFRMHFTHTTSQPSPTARGGGGSSQQQLSGGGRKSPLEMSLNTLKKMAMGGIHDHLGGGFHRYSVDDEWHVPHFEKMLYDQAQLEMSYCDAYQITKEPFYANILRGILGYVSRDLTDGTTGAFFCAEDADSDEPPEVDVSSLSQQQQQGEAPKLKPTAAGGGAAGPSTAHAHAKRGEGAFYAWTHSELFAILDTCFPKKERESKVPSHSDLFCLVYGVKADGNVKRGSDPHGEFKGKNVLIQRATAEEAAERYLDALAPSEIEQRLADCRKVLKAVRDQRPRPFRDDKILTSWNGLMISAFARAFEVLGDESHLTSARRSADFILSTLRTMNGTLLRSYRQGPSGIEAFSVDYAFFIQGLLDLYEASGDTKYLQASDELQKKHVELFWDEEKGGFFETTTKDASIKLRMKELYDGAEPSANSVAAMNLARLSALLPQSTATVSGSGQPYSTLARSTIQCASAELLMIARALPQMLCALHFTTAPNVWNFFNFTIFKPKSEVQTSVSKIQKVIFDRFIPNKSILYFSENENERKWLLSSEKSKMKSEKSVEVVDFQKILEQADQKKEPVVVIESAKRGLKVEQDFQSLGQDISTMM